MLRNVTILVVLTVVAVVGMDHFTELMEAPPAQSAKTGNVSKPKLTKVSTRQNRARDEEQEDDSAYRDEPDEDEEEEASSGDGDELILTAGAGGHYFVDAAINGEGVHFLVDTGASLVALSRSDAQKLGIDLEELKFTGRAKTANGIARVAPIMLAEVEIGENVVENVPAAVIDAPMDISLLGMSFLKRLSGFEIKDNKLIMRW